MLDSSRWQEIRLRKGDVIVDTWAKSGTTWVVQILAQLFSRAAVDNASYEHVPWVESRLTRKIDLTRLDAQANRRILKSHLSADALPVSDCAKYVFVARDGRDAVLSWHNHHRMLTPQVIDLINRVPNWDGPRFQPACADFREFFREWLSRDGFPLWPFWSHIQSWWDLRHRKNVLLVHFSALKNDLPSEILRIAAFLNIEIDSKLLKRVARHCTFDYMQRNAATIAPSLEHAFLGGAKTFVNRGENGRWWNLLEESDIESYIETAKENLEWECAKWLEGGELHSPLPEGSRPPG